MHLEKPILVATLAAMFHGCPVFADGPGLPAAAVTQPLFHIERSKNANEVHYVACLATSGGLDVKKPVHAFWINWAKDSTGKNRTELSAIQRRLAFGFSIERREGLRSCTMKLVCCKDRPIEVSVIDGLARAHTVINDKTAVLRKIKVVTLEKKILPTVLSVTISGTDIETGREISEIIVPE